MVLTSSAAPSAFPAASEAACCGLLNLVGVFGVAPDLPAAGEGAMIVSLPGFDGVELLLRRLLSGDDLFGVGGKL